MVNMVKVSKHMINMHKKSVIFSIAWIVHIIRMCIVASKMHPVIKANQSRVISSDLKRQGLKWHVSDRG